MLARVVVMTALLGSAACGRIGYTSRVLHRLPSPDGTLVAVCQEIPEFDGPGYDVRIERGDGTRARDLYTIGDGDPCSELTWSPDGRLLAVLSAQVARVRVVDVAWALGRRADDTAYWSWPQFDLGVPGGQTLGGSLAFVAPAVIEMTTCTYSLERWQRTQQRTCDGPARHRRITLPADVYRQAADRR